MSKVICQDCVNIVKSYTAKSVIHVTNKQTCQKCENLLQYMEKKRKTKTSSRYIFFISSY